MVEGDGAHRPRVSSEPPVTARSPTRHRAELPGAYRLRMTDAHDEYLIAIGFDPHEWRSERGVADVLVGDDGEFDDDR